MTDDACQRIILALDRPDRESALDLVDRLPNLVWVKVGLELFTAEGPSVVRELAERGKRVFLDLKLHDIPNTVAAAVRSAQSTGASLLTLHAEGGPAMMRAAVEARGDAGPRLLAVTVLTSLTGEEYPEVYRNTDAGERVRVFAQAAEAAGVDGVVCSPKELAVVGKVVSSDFLRVTPGIRPAGAGVQDQARVATPGAALAAGATHLVIGRAITGSADPAAALAAIASELNEAAVR